MWPLHACCLLHGGRCVVKTLPLVVLAVWTLLLLLGTQCFDFAVGLVPYASAAPYAQLAAHGKRRRLQQQQQQQHQVAERVTKTGGWNKNVGEGGIRRFLFPSEHEKNAKSELSCDLSGYYPGLDGATTFHSIDGLARSVYEVGDDAEQVLRLFAGTADVLAMNGGSVPRKQDLLMLWAFLDGVSSLAVVNFTSVSQKLFTVSTSNGNIARKSLQTIWQRDMFGSNASQLLALVLERTLQFENSPHQDTLAQFEYEMQGIQLRCTRQWLPNLHNNNRRAVGADNIAKQQNQRKFLPETPTLSNSSLNAAILKSMCALLRQQPSSPEGFGRPVGDSVAATIVGELLCTTMAFDRRIPHSLELRHSFCHWLMVDRQNHRASRCFHSLMQDLQLESFTTSLSVGLPLTWDEGGMDSGWLDGKLLDIIGSAARIDIAAGHYDAADTAFSILDEARFSKFKQTDPAFRISYLRLRPFLHMLQGRYRQAIVGFSNLLLEDSKRPEAQKAWESMPDPLVTHWLSWLLAELDISAFEAATKSTQSFKCAAMKRSAENSTVSRIPEDMLCRLQEQVHILHRDFEIASSKTRQQYGCFTIPANRAMMPLRTASESQISLSSFEVDVNTNAELSNARVREAPSVSGWQPRRLRRLPSRQEMREFVIRREPFIISPQRDADGLKCNTSCLPDLLGWSTRKWNPSYLCERIGNEVVNFAKGASVNGDFLSEIQTSFPSRRQFVFSGTTMLQRVHAPLCSFLHSIFHSGFQNNNEPLQNVDAQQPSANGTGAMQKHWGLYFDAGSMPRGGKGTQTKLDASGSDEIYAFPLNRMSQDVPIPPFLDSATLQKVSLWMGHTNGPASEASSGLHYDKLDNLHVVLHGRKLWNIFSPADAQRMAYYMPPRSVSLTGDVVQPKFERENNIYQAYGYTSLLRFSRQTTVVGNPRFSNAQRSRRAAHSEFTAATRSSFVLEAGEALFLPGGWAHDVQSEGGPHVAVTFWNECKECRTWDDKFAKMGVRGILTNFGSADAGDSDGGGAGNGWLSLGELHHFCGLVSTSFNRAALAAGLDLKAALPACQKPSKLDLEALFLAFDQNNDGRMSRLEFMRWASAVYKNATNQVAARSLQQP